ncbi:MAG: Hydroxyacid dehydrogenase [Micavibrio sp.]|nr:Hydroxyacid dehydrogenase [Micavibrio sp.]
MTRTLLALGNLLPDEMAFLEQHFRVIRLWREQDPEAVLQQERMNIVAVLSIAGVPVRTHLIEALPNLEIIAQNGVGVDNIDLKFTATRGIAVTNTPDVLTDDTADTALALLLAVARRVCEGDMYVRVGKWANGPMPLGTSLAGKTAGVVGLGRIGHAIARRCAAFGMNIAYHGRSKKDVPYTYYDDVKVMAEASDFLILACAATPQTRDLINYDVLEALGKRGILVNVARGSVVKELDLLAALSNRTIAGAGLDVYQNEPNVPEALISMDNVVLLPHVGSATLETRTKMGQLVVQNLMAHFEGRPLLTPVAV